jgi:hypothetical protein
VSCWEWNAVGLDPVDLPSPLVAWNHVDNNWCNLADPKERGCAPM